MEAAGNQNRPPPASENAIDTLPRLTVDQAMLGELDLLSMHFAALMLCALKRQEPG